MAADKFVSGVRLSSICSIIDATDLFCICAKSCNASINSGSSDILVWWPDKDTDIFFIIFSPQPGNPIMRAMHYHTCAMGLMLNYQS